MLDLAMDIPMLLDTTTLARGLPMLSLRQRLMLILLFFMDPIMADMAWVMLDMLDLAMDIFMVPMDMADMAWVMPDMPLTLMAMLATHMPGEN